MVTLCMQWQALCDMMAEKDPRSCINRLNQVNQDAHEFLLWVSNHCNQVVRARA
jgi:hypothetical protein